jgi:methionine aminopeptidase
VHIDGYVAVQATTVVVRADENMPVTGKAADVIQCAQTCFEAAVRLIRPGRRISEVAGPLNQIADIYGCCLVDGVMTHNMKQFVIDGNKCILNRPTPDQKVEDAPIQELEVYAIDIVVSTGMTAYESSQKRICEHDYCSWGC